MSSALYLSYPNLLKADIDAVLRALRIDGEESATGKTILLLAYIMDTAGTVHPDRLMMPDVRSILDRGFGWKVRRFFRETDLILDDQYKRFKGYLRLRMTTCYRRRYHG